ncbi:hypothetical protein A3K64_00165 [Candidatus Micrarchaeota archaeon RBG_16_36_9]|nr:MAG: hypothetical protein A3K64_00165 [Candidatus Micrarchaeota archaeon RBG_16_36_9]
MEDHIIETSIDELIHTLKQKEKMSLSEISDFLKLSQKQMEPLINVLEEKGIIEIKYPVIGEPKVILKPNAPERVEIKKSEIIEEIKPGIKKEVIENRIEKPKTSERLEAKTEIINDNETMIINKKVEKLESDVSELSGKVDTSVFKEDLFEILLIIAGLKDIEKVSFYLREILNIIHKMKEKKIWTNEDKDLVVVMLNNIANNWRDFNEEDIAKLFDDIKGKVETA